jgi:hypothetical protein
MIIISSRDDFINPDRLLPEGHLIKEIDMRDDSIVRSIELDELATELSGRKICIAGAWL